MRSVDVAALWIVAAVMCSVHSVQHSPMSLEAFVGLDYVFTAVDACPGNCQGHGPKGSQACDKCQRRELLATRGGLDIFAESCYLYKLIPDPDATSGLEYCVSLEREAAVIHQVATNTTFTVPLQEAVKIFLETVVMPRSSEFVQK